MEYIDYDKFNHQQQKMEPPIREDEEPLSNEELWEELKGARSDFVAGLPLN